MNIPSTDRERKKPVHRVASLLVGAVLIAPVIVYLLTFGPQITSDHTRWGEMGSAMSGIYTPILSLLTLAVLVAQVRSQVEINTHQFDQSYIAEARSDIEYYLAQLDQELLKTLDDGTSIRQALHLAFAHAAIEELKSAQASQLAKAVNVKLPKVFSVWLAINTIFVGLASQKRFPYTNNFDSAKQKTIAILSYETCVALDNYSNCVSGGDPNLQFYFSSELSKDARGL